MKEEEEWGGDVSDMDIIMHFPFFFFSLLWLPSAVNWPWKEEEEGDRPTDRPHIAISGVVSLIDRGNTTPFSIVYGK